MREVWVATVLGSALIMTLVVIQGLRESAPIGAYFIAAVPVVAVTFLSAYFVSRQMDRSDK